MINLRLVPPVGAPIDVVKDQTTVGREPVCDVVLEHGSISRRHAWLERRGTVWFVVDHGSANGTFVDSLRVTESALRDGQELRFGGLPFRVQLTGAGVAPGATMLMPGSGPPTAGPPRPTMPPVAVIPTRPGSAALPHGAEPPPPLTRPYVAAPPPPPPRPGPSAASRPPRPVSGEAPAPVKKGKGPFFWVAAGCGGCLLMVLLAVGATVGGVFFLTRGARDVVSQQLAEIKRGQMDAAYARLSTELRGRVSPEAFAAFVARHPGLKENADATFTSRNFRNEAATLGGTLTTASGAKEPVRYELVKEDAAWKVADIVVGEESASASGVIARARGPEALRLNHASVQKRRDDDLTRVVVSVEAAGFKVRPEDEAYVIDLALDVETIGPDGLRVEALSKPDVQRLSQRTSLETGAVATLSTPLLLDPSTPPGAYTVRLTVRDLVGGARAGHEVRFDLP